jgi:hypothetical protein
VNDCPEAFEARVLLATAVSNIALHRRRRLRDAAASLHKQVLLGSSVGLACGGTYAILLGFPAALVAFGAALGIASGFVAGLLLWIGTADLPEEPIPPVRAGDERGTRKRP